MWTERRRGIVRFGATALLIACHLPWTWAGDSPARVRGAGVQECAEYRWAWQGRSGSEPQAVAEYRSYRAWLAGFVSGLDVATGMDVLAGVPLDQALDRIAAWCQTHPREDFITATRDLIRMLSRLPTR